MGVNEDPISQWVLKLDFNDVLAGATTSEGSGGGDYQNLDLSVGFPQQRHFWVSLA